MAEKFDIAWLKKQVDGLKPNCEDNPDGWWGWAEATVEELNRTGTPCEACRDDFPADGSVREARRVLAALKAADFPAPMALYCHCWGSLFAEWAFGFEPGKKDYVKISIDFRPDGENSNEMMVSYGPGRATEFGVLSVPAPVV